MNTPAHVILNVALLTRGKRHALARPVIWGALLPDLPMFFFYGWVRFAAGLPDRMIWSHAYFECHWQDFFDVFNSIPLALLALAAFVAARRTGSAAFCASMLLHDLMDLPLHREDAHRHFFPVSDFRFVSPISYWDPAHFGAWAAFAEAALVTACAAVLWRRFPAVWSRVVCAALAILEWAAWVAFHGLGPPSGA